MALLSDYVNGSITVTNGSVDFTGTGTAWRLANIREGDTLQLQNLTAVIAANSPTDPLITSNTAGKFTTAWTGASGTFSIYRIRYMPDGARVTAETRTLIELLGNGNLTAFAGLSGTTDTIGYFNGIGTMALTALTALGRALIGSSSAVAVQASIGIQEHLTANQNWYVATTGDDALNTGRTVGSPFRTIGKALDVIYGSIMARAFRNTINVANGTYPENIAMTGLPSNSGSRTGSIFPIYIVGNVGSPSSCVIAGAGNSFFINGGARVDIHGFRLAPTVANSYCIYTSDNGTQVNFGNMEFGQVNYDHIVSSTGSVVTFDAPYTIIGGALNHIHASEMGYIKYIGGSPVTVTLTGTPAFTGQFLGNAWSNHMLNNVTYSGAATGRKFLIHYNGAVRTLNSTQAQFPGSVRGIEDGGGRLDYGSRFHVTKGGTSQTILNNSTEQFITFGTVVENLGDGGWNTTGLWFNPRAGTCAMSCSINFSGGFVAGNLIQVSIYKNGASYKTAISCTNSTGPHSLGLSLALEKCTGDDVYQVYARCDGTGSVTVNGSSAATYFMGTQY